MRFLFLNQYFPPDPAPTGVLLRELATMLEAAGHACDFVAARQDYRGGQQKGGRMRREMIALARMLADGCRRTRPDVVISASSPPCLLAVAAIVARRHRARSVHWIMDVYPEIAVALGEIRAGVLSRLIAHVMGRGYRSSTVVALDADMAECVRRHGVEARIIRPWVFEPVLKVLPDRAAPPGAEWTWIYSGNLGRAHEWRTLLDAQAILERKGADIRLLFQGGGPSRLPAEQRATELGLKHCEWRGYVDESELPRSLAACHVLTVTQLPAAQGLLWPSKLGLVLSLARPILWVGPTDGAIARMLRDIPHAGIFAPGDADGVAKWLLTRRAEPAIASPAVDPAAHRAECLAQWRELLAQGGR